MIVNRHVARVLRVFAWCGPATIVIFAIGFAGFSTIFPPTHPTESAQAIAAHFAEHATRIRVGQIFMLVGLSLFVPWEIAITVCIRRMERAFPIITYASLAAIGSMQALNQFTGVLFAVAAYRADEISPEITRIFVDFGWFMFLYIFPIFSIWNLLIAWAIFADHNEPSIFPRWLAYYNIFTAIDISFVGLLIFFKDGPFAYNGVMVFWIPLPVFFGWMLVTTWAVLRARKRLLRADTVSEPDAAVAATV